MHVTLPAVLMVALTRWNLPWQSCGALAASSFLYCALVLIWTW